MKKITFALVATFITSFGFAQSATVTFNQSITFDGAEFVKLFEPGELTGTLTDVEIYGVLSASTNLTYANDLTIYVTPTDVFAAGGLLQIGGFSNLAATQWLDWPCGAACDDDEIGTVVEGLVSVNAINFTDNPTYTVWIGNGYANATTSGTWDNVEVTLEGVEDGLGFEDQAISGFTQFYNPQSNNLTITADESFSSINLYNVLGQEVLSRNLTSNNEVINLSNLRSGIFIANVTSNSKSISFKIVKR